MTIRFGQAMAVAAFVIGTGLSAAAWASGGGGGTSGGSSDDQKKKDNPQYSAAVDKIKARDYAGGLALLEDVVKRDPRNTDAWNYIGFSDRMMGNFTASLSAYETALALNPDHIGANEYLGELYLQTGETDKAARQLAKLKQLCGENCGEYVALKEAIGGNKAALLDEPKGW